MVMSLNKKIVIGHTI